MTMGGHLVRMVRFLVDFAMERIATAAPEAGMWLFDNSPELCVQVLPWLRTR
jgi:hypothetical protein